MKSEDRMTPPPSGHSGRSGKQGNPPVGATVLQPIVEERVREVVKERVENRYIEVPQVFYVEKVVEVPREVPEEKIIRVVKPVKKEVIKYVKKPVFVDKIVEVPEIKYVDKVVEVPRYAIKEKIVEVPKVLVIERIIPVLKSYRKEHIVHVDPGSHSPFGRPHGAPFLPPQPPQPPRNFMETPSDGGTTPLSRPGTMAGVPSGTQPPAHSSGLSRTPPHMLTRKGSFASEPEIAVRKFFSAPGFEGEAAASATQSPNVLKARATAPVYPKPPF